MTRSLPPDLATVLGEIRAHTAEFKAGDDGSPYAFQQLAVRLLGLTVARSHSLRLTGGPRRDYWVLSGMEGPLDPVPLTNGRYLRTTVSLYLDRAAGRLKVSKASYQYQLDEEGEDWVFRYDYLREPGSDPYPTSHLNVNGDFSLSSVGCSLKSVHFPVSRASLESVIRLLIEDFGVEPAESADIWRPALGLSESLFQEIAHVPLSGPTE